MTHQLLSIMLIAAVAAAATATASPATVAPTYTVNLDLPPIQRWQHIVSKYDDVFPDIVKYINTLIPQWAQKLLDPIMVDLDKHLGVYGDELRGVANASQVSLPDIVAINLIYDFTAACTSIVAQASNGTIMHCRNLDYGIPDLKNLTAIVNFEQQGKVVHQCTTFVGYVGCLTGMHPGRLSVSVDERDVKNETVLENILALLEGGRPLGFFVREVLANATGDFEASLEVIANTHLIAPVYIIVAGAGVKNAGAVVTRDRPKARDVWRLDVDNGAWWRVETNYDHWVPPPPNDDRRDPANKMMKAIGQENLTIDHMYQVLSTHPVLNSGTKYTAMMVPSMSMYQTMIRWDD